MAKPRTRPPARRLILDSGAVIALARRDTRARAVLQSAWELGAEVLVPAVVLAETVRGAATDAPVNQILTAIGRSVPIDDDTGRRAGALLGATGTAHTVDALVVAAAIGLGGGVILTGDAGDLRVLAADHPEVIIQAL